MNVGIQLKYEFQVSQLEALVITLASAILFSQHISIHSQQKLTVGSGVGLFEGVAVKILASQVVYS